MPQLDDTRESLLQGGRKAKTRASRFWTGFADFALQDNVLEVAVGLMYVFISFFFWFWCFGGGGFLIVGVLDCWGRGRV